ncbi:MAG: metallophosphoesterase [Bacteroidales bacterium]|nr:metallophosphoesterase [Bacteroidales bacterium]
MKRLLLIAVLGVMAALLAGSCSQRTFSFVQMTDPQIGFRDKSPGFVYTDSLFAEAVRKVNSSEYHGYKSKNCAPSADFVIITGDLVNDQRDALQDSIYRANRAKIDVPVYEIPGNHDIRPWTPDNHSNYLALRGYDRFSFKHKGCAFIGIDSNCIVDSSDEDRGGDVKISPSDKAAAAQAEAEQLEWLKEELRKAQRCRYTFVFTHCPVILKDIDEENNYFNFPKKKRAEYIALFKKYEVDVVFAGHTHMDYDTTAEGIRFVTAGPVGSPLGRGYSGYELVTVSKDSVRCTFLSTH